MKKNKIGSSQGNKFHVLWLSYRRRIENISFEDYLKRNISEDTYQQPMPSQYYQKNPV